MKKYISMMLLALSFGFVSCDVETDEDPGGTNVEDMSGHWTVTFEQSYDEYVYLFKKGTNPNLDSKSAAELDALEWADVYGTGKVSVYTYNTADNVNNAMWISDYAAKAADASFWQFKVKAAVDYSAKTFSLAETANTSYDGCNVTIVGGKVLKGAAVTPRGAKADSIVAYVKFSDDKYGFTYMKMSGYRFTGFDADK